MVRIDSSTLGGGDYGWNCQFSTMGVPLPVLLGEGSPCGVAIQGPNESMNDICGFGMGIESLLVESWWVDA